MKLSPIADGMTTQNEGGADAGAAAGEPGAGAPPQGLPLDKTQVGAAISKLISASIGDLVVVMSKSPAHKHTFLADIEWRVILPVLAGQFYVAEFTSPANGAHAPVAFVTWATVSAQTAERLKLMPAGAVRLQPEEWSGGPHTWLIDAIGVPPALAHALQTLAANKFKHKSHLQNSPSAPDFSS